jgi:hypothetical protein
MRSLNDLSKLLHLERIYKMPQKDSTQALQNDKRIISRRLLAGELSEKELNSLLKKLPDVAENAEEISCEEAEAKQ